MAERRAPERSVPADIADVVELRAAERSVLADIADVVELRAPERSVLADIADVVELRARWRSVQAHIADVPAGCDPLPAYRPNASAIDRVAISSSHVRSTDACASHRNHGSRESGSSINPFRIRFFANASYSADCVFFQSR